MPPRYPCQPFACAVQKCLTDNNFDQTKCAQAVKKLEDCCLKERRTENGKVIESEGCVGVLSAKDKRESEKGP